MAASPYNRRNNPMSQKTGAMRGTPPIMSPVNAKPNPLMTSLATEPGVRNPQALAASFKRKKKGLT